MKVGVIGSGSIGPDLAYGFVSALAKEEGNKVFLLDVKKEALDAGMERIGGYVSKAVSRGKLSPKAAKSIEQTLVRTMEMKDFAPCDYVLEAATEDLPVKKAILKNLEDVVSKDCLVGFATSGIPRAQIAADAKHPSRCFVNHPFYPAWRSLPIEVVLSDDKALSARMLSTLKTLGKVPIVTADAPCFAADDIFCNYCAEAARLVEEGVATPAQIDKVVNDFAGGGGPLNVLDLTRGNHLVVHCQELMKNAPTGSAWFSPPALLTKQGNKPWRDPKRAEDATCSEAKAREILDRMLAVLFARTFFVVDHGVCDPSDLNWLTITALGFSPGLLDLAEKLGMEHVSRLCTAFAAKHPGFEVPKSVAEKKMPRFWRDVTVERDGEIAVVTVRRPEVKNALSARALSETRAAFEALAADALVKGAVLTGFGGDLAGADIGELQAAKDPDEAEAISRRGHAALQVIAEMSKPVVAALEGVVLGGGAEISRACPARVAGKGLMMGQPEVNLGIIPGWGGTQRLPRLIGLERGLDLLRSGRAVGAKEACEWGWAVATPADNAVQAAKDLVRQHLAGKVKLAPVDAKPMTMPASLPKVDIGHRSLAIDAILVDVVREGLKKPLAEGLALEAKGFARCKKTVDMNIGMKNFLQNGPRVPAAFLHE